MYIYFARYIVHIIVCEQARTVLQVKSLLLVHVLWWYVDASDVGRRSRSKATVALQTLASIEKRI